VREIYDKAVPLDWSAGGDIEQKIVPRFIELVFGRLRGCGTGMTSLCRRLL
jgi:hypothetical protein